MTYSPGLLYDPFQLSHGDIQALPYGLYNASPSMTQARVAHSPAATLDDLTASYGGHRPGQYVVAASERAPRQLAAPVDMLDSTVTLRDASNMPAAGYLLIGTELLRYSAREGNTLTGVKRALAGTAAARYHQHREVRLAGWYLCTGTFMMYCGPLEPRADIISLEPNPRSESVK